MSRHPIDGVKGSKRRVPGENSAEKADRKVSKVELSRLNRQYLESRNRAQAAKAAAAEMEIAARRGKLISKRLACMQVAYLLTCHRQQVLAEPAILARQLVAGGFLEEKHEHEARELVKSSLSAMLEELSDLPRRVADPAWAEKIDPDLRSQVEGDGETERVTDPSGIRRKNEQAKRRREQKTKAMRKARAEKRA